MILLLALAALQDPVEALMSADAAERAEAERRLLDLGDAALPALRARLDDPDDELRARVRALVRRIEWDALLDPGLLGRYPPLHAAYLRGEAKAFFDAAQRTHAMHVSPHEGLEAWLYHALDLPDVRDSALHRLIHWNAPDTRRRPAGRVARLVAAWTPDDGLPRLGSLALLGARLATPCHRDEILPLKPAHPDGAAALRLLQVLAGDRGEEPVLLDILQSPSSPLRPAAVQAALRLRYAPAGPVLAGLLDNPAVYSMIPWGSEEILDAEERLVKIIASRKPADRGGIFANAVRKFRWTSAAPAYLDVLRTLPPGEWRDALPVLAELGSTEAFDLVFERYSGPLPPLHEPLPSYGSPEHRRRLPDSTPYDLAAMADGPRAQKLLSLLEAPDVRHRNGAAHAVGSFRHPEARAAALERIRRETRPELRKAMLQSFYGGILHRNLDSGPFLELCERLVRDDADPLAAALLLRRRGRDALPLAMDVARRSVPVPDELVWALSLDRPAGLEEVLGRSATPAALALLEALASPAAEKEFDRLRREAETPELRLAAAASLMRLRRKVLPELSDFLKAREGYSPWEGFLELLRDGTPGFREAYRASVLARGVPESLWHLRNYAEPEWIPELQKVLAAWDKAAPERVAREDFQSGMCATGLTWDRAAVYALEALERAGDATLAPLFVAHLRDAEPSVQQAAAAALGRWKAVEAAPLLRRLARAGTSSVRNTAIDALARLELPGTAEFLRPLLADAPAAVAAALARLRVDARADLRALYAYENPPPRVLLAVERMTHPRVYAGLEARERLPSSLLVADLPALLSSRLGKPVRFSARGEALRRSYSHGLERTGPLEGAEDLFRLYLPLFRGGVIELVTPDEALAAWRR